MSASQSHSQSLSHLRATVYRLQSTPTQQLPHIAQKVAAQLWNCSSILSTSQTTKTGNEASNLVQRLRTSISSLLQDRNIYGRWSGVVLVKAAIEAGGLEVLSKSTGWVKTLLAILKKQDPPTTRNLAAITLTRLFMLTWDHENLVREITTPNLPSFVTTCLANVERKSCESGELQTVLEAFATLIARHPTIFRTSEERMRALLLKVLSSTHTETEGPVPSNTGLFFTQQNKDAARRLLVSLYHCAPKQTAAEKWDEFLKSVTAAAHSTCDSLFRAVGGQTRHHQTSAVSGTLDGDPGSNRLDEVGLGPWEGILAGAERLGTLLELLKTLLDTPTKEVVNIRLGLLIELLMRLSGVTVDSTTFRSEVSRDEREALLSILPTIHKTTLSLVDAMLLRFRTAISSSFQTILLDVVLPIFDAESYDDSVRVATYGTLLNVLELVGLSLSKNDVEELAPIIKLCCRDLMPSSEKATSNAENGNISQSGKASGRRQDSSTLELNAAAQRLLPAIFINLNPTYVPRKLRVLMERTAVLTRNKDALMACVMSQPQSRGTQASLLPLLARLFPDAVEVESILRPRMPPLTVSGSTVEPKDEDDEDEDGAIDELDQNGHTGDGGEHEDIEAVAVENGYDDEDKAQADQNTQPAAGTKRSAPDRGDEDAGDIDALAKRLRVSPEPSPIGRLEDFATAATKDHPATYADDGPTRSKNHDIRATIAPEEINTKRLDSEVRVEPAVPTGTNEDEDGSGSDFELPPLTMEPDTDPEDEEEEDDVEV